MNKKMKIAKKLDIYNIMPYTHRGNCVYKKDTGEEVGCTKGDINKFFRCGRTSTVYLIFGGYTLASTCL